MNSGSEALEEGLQSILEPYLWEAVSGEEANVNWEEALYSSLMGFITGGLFEGVDMAIDTAAKVTNRIITKADIGNMEALINPIHEVTGVSAEQLQNPLPSQIDPVNPNMTAENVGQQSETDQAMKNQASAAVHQEAVAQSLRIKGISSQKAAGIADAIAARLNGQELTKAQRNILSSAINSPSVQSVISDMQKMQKGSPKLLAGNIGKSTGTVQPINNQADVAQSLRNKGINSQKADSIAEAITASLNGQELTRTQREILSFELRRPSVQNIISDLIQKKTNGIDSTQHNGYDEVDTTGDSATTEDAAPQQVQNTVSEGSYEGGSKTITQLLKETTCGDYELYVYLSKQAGSDAAEAFAKNGTWPNEVQIPKSSSVLNSDGSINWSRAPQGGYVLDADGNAIKEAFIPKIGEVIDRYGPANGRYTSPVIDGKDFSYSERSLPYVEDASKYHRYEVTGDFAKIEEYVKNCANSELKAKIDAAVTAYYDGDYSKLVSHRGKVAEIEGWGQGGATQYEFSLSIEVLVELGLLKEIR